MQKIIKQVLKKYIWILTFITVFIIINMYTLTLPAKIIGKIIDLMMNLEQNMPEITVNLIYLIGSVFLYLLTRIPWRSLSTYVARSFEKQLKDKIFSQFMKLKMTDIENIKNGEFMSYFTKDISEIRAFFYRIVSYGIRIIAIVVIALCTMISSVNLKLTLITLCPIIITGYLVIKIKKYVEKSFKKSQEYFTDLSEYVQESTDSIRTIKAYSRRISSTKRIYA